MAEASQEGELLKTLGDFTSKENWDKFFTIRGSGDPFEWYAEWPDLRDPLLSELSGIDNGTPVVAGTPAPDVPAPTTSAQILVPGCGNSRLSENLYDAGFHGITNIDFSKVVISDMLRRNVRSRPDMRWRVMDMTQMQLMDETFDAVLDKGGLDALMEPELGSKLGSQYLSEVKRILKSGGKFICLTLAESHVLELLFSKFRHGWKTYLQAIPQKQSKKPSFQTFMVVVVKDASALLHQIGSLIDLSSLDCNGYQGRGLLNAVEKENDIRKECSVSVDILYSVEDLQLGIKGDLKELIPGRRFQLILDDQGASRFSYKAVLLDAPQQCDTFLYQCGVFLVPKSRAHEWLFSSEGGQWVVVESSKTARLIMVLLDERHSHTSMDDIQKDLSPLVKRLAPRNCDNGAQIPFMMSNDGVKQRNVVKKATSTMTGPIIVEDVIYENFNGNSSGLIQSNSMPSDNMMFRRLIFQRNQGLVQSEALVVGAEFPEKVLGDSERKKTSSSSKSKRRGSHRKIDSCISISNEHGSKLKVDHSYLASSYHAATVSGFILIASNLESVAPSETVKTVVIGLGAGLLPMFLHQCMPFLDIEVVELDSMILDLARDYFSFSEDKQLKVRIADGIHYVRDVANAGATGKATVHQGNEDASSKEFSFQNDSCMRSLVESNKRSRIDVLIIDVDSYDLSSGLTCPAADFVEESFLLTVKESLSDQGLFVINLVTRSSAIRETVVSRMKVVFARLFSLQLEEEVNEVLFALNTEVCIEDGRFPEPSLQLERLLKSKNKERCQNIMDTAKRIKCLK